MHGSVTALSLSLLLQRCQFTSITHQCCCHRCHSTVTIITVTLVAYCHRCDISVDISVTLVQNSTDVPPLWDSSCVQQLYCNISFVKFITDFCILRVHFFGKNPNPDSESKNGFFVSLAKSKKGLNPMNPYAMKIQWINPNLDFLDS